MAHHKFEDEADYERHYERLELDYERFVNRHHGLSEYNRAEFGLSILLNVYEGPRKEDPNLEEKIASLWHGVVDAKPIEQLVAPFGNLAQKWYFVTILEWIMHIFRHTKVYLPRNFPSNDQKASRYSSWVPQIIDADDDFVYYYYGSGTADHHAQVHCQEVDDDFRCGMCWECKANGWRPSKIDYIGFGLGRDV